MREHQIPSLILLGKMIAHNINSRLSTKVNAREDIRCTVQTGSVPTVIFTVSASTRFVRNVGPKNHAQDQRFSSALRIGIVLHAIFFALVNTCLAQNA
jgi:hypothetical protein